MRTTTAVIMDSVFVLTLAAEGGGQSLVQRKRPTLEQRVTALEEGMTAVEDQLAAIEDRVTASEAHLTDAGDRVTALEDRVTALEQAAGGLAVYDAQNVKVGPVVGVDSFNFFRVWVALRVQGYAFALRVERELLTGNTNPGEPENEVPYFEAADCTGQAYVLVGDDRMLVPRVAVNLPGRTVYLQEPGSVSRTPTLRSFLAERSGGCQPIFTNIRPVFPAIPVVDLNMLFTPPFSMR